MSILITGGAGYVGSHVLSELRAEGIACVVLDNLSRGHRELVRDADLIVGDVADSALVRRIIGDYGVTAVMHFAAYAYVGESVAAPLTYYANNVAATVGLLRGMIDGGVKQLVFSSTCATYGVPEAIPITEDHPQRPINPYGATKLMVERILDDVGRAHGLRSVVLRYFNAAGADPLGAIGECHAPETHLIPLALQAAAGHRAGVQIYGTDYPTADGTCVRDYIHVVDLAQAHILGLRYLEGGRPSAAFNLGNGNGFSVLEVLRMVERVSGRAIKATTAPRRPGDPPALVGSAHKARRVLGWSPRFDTLEAIVETAWKWHSTRPATVESLARHGADDPR
jgi:UDP-glucose 4-epimerase